MWPPSSCPPGNRFKAVANNPTQAATAIGCNESRETGSGMCIRRAARWNKRGNPALDANESPERSDQARKRHKIWQRGVHAIVARVKVVSHLVRQENKHQRQGEWKPGQQLGRMHNRTQREQRRTVVTKPESWLLMFEIELDTGAHRRRSDEGREQQHDVNPQPAPQGLDDPDFMRVHWFRRDRRRGSRFRHTVAGY